MRDEIVVACLSLALAGCGSQTQETDGGIGGGGIGGGGIGGLSGTGGTPAAGGATSAGGMAAASGNSGSSDQGGASNAGSSGSSGTAGNGGVGGGGAGGVGGIGGLGGATVNGGTTGAGGAASGGTAGSSAGSMSASGASGASGAGGGSGASGASGSGGAPDAGTGPGGAGGGAPTCAAGLPAPTAGDSTVTLQHGGRSRKYLLHVPAGLTAGTPISLVFDLHGAGGNGSQQKGLSGFSSLADRERFLVVFPDGVDGYWNVDDKCCGTAGREKVDDVGFLRTIITTLSERICIDTTRVYVSGFSNGGGLTHRMGCDAADVIAGVAPIATDLRTQPCNAARPISMLEVRGMADSLEPYEGGLVGPEGGQYVLVGAKASLALWADINQCTGATTQSDEYCETVTECGGGVETVLCSLPNVEHSPYNNALRFDVAGVAWDMFKRHSL
jgi:polyhydroxybutyrate depolymerase